MHPTPAHKKQIWILSLLIAIIVGPMLFAWVLVQKNEKIQFKLNHHGDLISPLPTLKAFAKTDFSPYQGKWLMMIVTPTQCDTSQTHWFYQLHQMKIALGKNASRLEQVFVSLSPEAATSCETSFQNYTDVASLMIAEDQFVTHLGAYSQSIKREQYGELFLVDPKGHIMMHYDANVPVKDVLTDVKRLLRVSKIG